GPAQGDDGMRQGAGFKCLGRAGQVAGLGSRRQVGDLVAGGGSIPALVDCPYGEAIGSQTVQSTYRIGSRLRTINFYLVDVNIIMLDAVLVYRRLPTEVDALWISPRGPLQSGWRLRRLVVGERPDAGRVARLGRARFVYRPDDIMGQLACR